MTLWTKSVRSRYILLLLGLTSGLAKDPETRPFVEAYNAGLNDDDHDEFAHLARDDETFISTLGNHEVDGDDDNDEDEDDAPGMVSVEELRQRARQVARGEEVRYPTMCKLRNLTVMKFTDYLGD